MPPSSNNAFFSAPPFPRPVSDFQVTHYYLDPTNSAEDNQNNKQCDIIDALGKNNGDSNGNNKRQAAAAGMTAMVTRAFCNNLDGHVERWQ